MSSNLPIPSMQIIHALKEYLGDVLNIQIEFHPWKRKKNLPTTLGKLYDFYQASLLSHTCLFLIPRKDNPAKPVTIRKHIKQLNEKWPGLFVYVSPKISSYTRKNLIKQCIPFIIPGNQMYLPELCVDLREHFQESLKGKQYLSPSAQAAFIYTLLHHKEKKFTPTKLAKKLGYTRMTMTRTFNEMESMNVGNIYRKGKERILHLTEDRQELWQQIKSLMRSPVKRTVFLKRMTRAKKIEKFGITSGLTAFSSLTMLNPPKRQVYAISQKNWTALRQSKRFEEVPHSDKADIELEIWNYDPMLFAKKGWLDLYSLYLSLQVRKDLKQLMDNSMSLSQ